MVATIPDELTLTPGFAPDQGGKPTVIMLYAWCGDRREDERVLEAVKGLGAPSMVQVGRTSPVQMLKNTDPIVLHGMSWIVRMVTLAKLEPGAVEALIGGMEHRSSPLSWMGIHPFHGVGERIPLESTAFGLRERHFMLGIFAAWEPGEDAPHRAWADAVEASLKRLALPSLPQLFRTGSPGAGRTGLRSEHCPAPTDQSALRPERRVRRDVPADVRSFQTKPDMTNGISEIVPAEEFREFKRPVVLALNPYNSTRASHDFRTKYGDTGDATS